MTFDQVYRLAREAGLDPRRATIATAIAAAESNNDPAAVGDVALQDATWGPSIGLWQIRSLKAQTGTGKARDASRLKGARFNARAMAEISAKGANFTPWSTYTNGAYRARLGEAAAISGQWDVLGGDVSSGANVPTAPTPAGGKAYPTDWSPLPGDNGFPGYADDLLGALGGQAVDQAGGALVAAVASQLLLAAALALGGTLIVIGAWRAVQ